MISISEATMLDFKIIQEIAYKTWPDTYGEILSKDQLHYMLESFYAIDALAANSENGHHFLLAKEKDSYLGFASYEPHYNGDAIAKIHKIYILPEAQGKGVGKLLIDAITNEVKSDGVTKLRLNVNRFNKAISFYKKQGFTIVAEEVIQLDHGYVMDDYVMEKQL